MKNILALRQEFDAALAAVSTGDDLDRLSTEYVGKKGVLKELLGELRNVPPETRKTVAADLNSFKTYLEGQLSSVSENLRLQETQRRISDEWQDVSLPGVAERRGARHPLSLIEDKCLDVLNLLGFSFVDGPEVENGFHNFDALNIPEHHPARDMQDTFWLENNLLLRSHTSTVQVRVLEQQKELPIRIASPGRVYRNETVDATHLACFHQFEGLWVDEGVKFSHLKGTLEFIIKNIFGTEWDYRFKPKFYPYTEPSIGVDIRQKGGDGKWITVLGAGMVHRNVLSQTGHDPERLSGFAFGLGISRMVTMAHEVSNMKSLYEGDLRVHQAISRKDYV